MEGNVISLPGVCVYFKGRWGLGTLGFVWRVGMACLISWVMFCFYFSPPCVCNEMAECTLTISAWNHSEVWLPHPSYLYRPLSRAASVFSFCFLSAEAQRAQKGQKEMCPVWKNTHVTIYLTILAFFFHWCWHDQLIKVPRKMFV